MENGKETREIARDYETPTLRIIELAADEVLAVGCKNRSGNAPGAAGCVSNRCNQPGS